MAQDLPGKHEVMSFIPGTKKKQKHTVMENYIHKDQQSRIEQKNIITAI